MSDRTWTCHKVQDGTKCGYKNPRVKKKCVACGKPRTMPKQAEHLAALKLPYEHYVEINGGDHCGICKRLPSATRHLDRDHDHRTGQPRGLLCPTCNRNLWYGFDSTWAEAALAYLQRAEARHSLLY